MQYPTPQELADFRQEARLHEQYNERLNNDEFELPYGFRLNGVFHDMEEDEDDD